MNIKCFAYQFDRLSKHTKLDVLAKLTNPGSSGMRSTIFSRLKVKDPSPHLIAYIAKDENKIIGWLLLNIQKESANIQVFVEKSYRRQGIGGRLIKMAKKRCKYQGVDKVTAFPWNRGGEKFFKAIGFDNIKYGRYRSLTKAA